ncbi:hypothetical protein JCM10049v2_002691 [Rhodotorula toruloides]
MARKKGVPQRSGLTRADYERTQREEAEKERLEEEERRRRQTALAAMVQARGPSGGTAQSTPAPPLPLPAGVAAPFALQHTPSPPVPLATAFLPSIPPPTIAGPAQVSTMQPAYAPAGPPMPRLGSYGPSSLPPPSQTNSLQPQQQPKFEHPPGLNRYAELYIPVWLRRVNADVPFQTIPRSPAESFSIGYQPLHNAIYPPQLISHLQDIERANSSHILRDHFTRSRAQSPSSGPGRPPALPLAPQTYAGHWLPLQQAEYTARGLQLQQANLYAVPLRPVARHPADPPGPPLYILEARSIREGWPPVDLGDILNLRQLRPAYSTWQGLEFHASVAGINRAAGEVMLRCDGLRGYEESMVFNVIWRVQDRIFNEWRHATELLQLHLGNEKAATSATNGTPTKRRRTAVESWLFPEKEDVSLDASAPTKEDLEPDWVDSSLNEEQRNAVRSMLWGRHRCPLLLHGPPGTGKTKTLVEGVFQILARHPDAHVLVCGASNPSTDTLATRLRALGPKNLFRLNSPSRPFAEVRGELLPFCHVENDRFALPNMSTLLSKRVICCSVLDASILLKGRVTNHDLSSLEVYTAGSIHPHKPPPLAQPHFAYLLVDEAAQATEPDIACALNVVATDDSRCHRAHVTVCGDPKQLGPHIVSEVARNQDFDVSLLERLMERPIYADHPYSRRNRSRHPDVRWEIKSTPFVDLVRNFRSTPEILWLPSTLFYHETLIPNASRSVQESPLRAWSRLSNPGFPILFQHVNGQDMDIDEGASFYNIEEVDAVVSLILSLVRPPVDQSAHGMVAAKEISVISPFREQVWRIRLALRAVQLGEVDVGNVEALQGAENRIVIISPVRSKELRWLPIDRAQDRGLLHAPKRFNVAMTRAKELLVIVGNAHTLTADPWWLAFYRLCVRNNCYVGPPLANPAAKEAGHAVSKLEQRYHAERSSRNSPALSPGANGKADGDDRQAQDKAFDILIGRLVSATVNEDES